MSANGAEQGRDGELAPQHVGQIDDAERRLAALGKDQRAREHDRRGHNK